MDAIKNKLIVMLNLNLVPIKRKILSETSEKLLENFLSVNLLTTNMKCQIKNPFSIKLENNNFKC